MDFSRTHRGWAGAGPWPAGSQTPAHTARRVAWPFRFVPLSYSIPPASSASGQKGYDRKLDAGVASLRELDLAAAGFGGAA